MAFPLITAALQLTPFVPMLARWLSGDNPGPIAEKVIEVAQTVSGATTPVEAVKAILSAPEKQTAFAMAMAAREDEMERAYLADRQNARARDIEIQKLGGKNQRADNLAYAVVIMLMICIIMLFLPTHISDPNEKLLYLIIGALIVMAKDVYGFEFGSSKHSERNAQALTDYISRGNGHSK